MSFHHSFVFCSAIGLLLTLGTVREGTAELIKIGSGTLTMSYDGSAFANTSNSNFGLSPANGDFMRYGRYWAPSETVSGPTFAAKAPQAFRPLPISNPGPGPNPKQPNFRDNFALLDPLYPVQSPTEVLAVNGRGTVANSEGRNRNSTTLQYDTNNVLGTMTGFAETNGVSAWWFANNDIMNVGGSWVSWGDLSLRYDASRVNYMGLGYSGWVIANQLGGIGDIFDTKNVTLVANGSGISISGQLFGSDGTSPNPYNENQATWETYTLMSPNLQVGTFSFTATAVPEPSSMIVLSMIGVGGVVRHLRRRQSKSCP